MRTEDIEFNSLRELIQKLNGLGNFPVSVGGYGRLFPLRTSSDRDQLVFGIDLAWEWFEDQHAWEWFEDQHDT